MNRSGMLVAALVSLALAVAPAFAGDGGGAGKPGGGGGKPGGAGNSRPAGGAPSGGGRPQASPPSRPPASTPAPSRPAPVSRPPAAPVNRPPAAPLAPRVAPPTTRTQPVTPPTVNRPTRDRTPATRDPVRTLPNPVRKSAPRSEEFARTPKLPVTRPGIPPPEQNVPYRHPSVVPSDRTITKPFTRPSSDVRRNERAIEVPRPSERLRETEREVASIPRLPTQPSHSTQPSRPSLPLERFDRKLVPPGTAVEPPTATPVSSTPLQSGSRGSDGFRGDSQHGGSHHGHHSHHDCDWWYANPCNRFVCWSGYPGYSFGYVFCGSSIYWYWNRPGCSPYYAPYSYYWSPACYYLPAYYPTYATVRYVDEYWDDGSYYPSYAEPAEPAAEPAPAPSAEDGAALLAAGWTQFQAGAYLDAIESFRQAVLANPADPQAKIAFAQALFTIGNYPDAAFLIRRTIELLPDWPVTGEDPRARYVDPADHAEQLVALRAFLERVPGEPAATLVLAVQNYFTGDLAAAREGFTMLAALDPDDLVAKRFLEQLAPAPAAPPAAPPVKDGG